MNVMMMLIRREFWEHRTLLIAPLALCIVYLIVCALAGANINLDVLHFGNEPPMSPAFLIVMHIVFTALLYGLMSVVAFFYLCDCLYSERKDRSILFWKSLPVSDAMTVISKAIVALIAIPLIVYVLALFTNLIAFVLLTLLFHPAAPSNATSDWTISGWLQLNGYLIADIFVLALWFAPVAAYQLLISVLVPRAVFVFTVLPPLALVFGERLFFGTWNIAEFLNRRLGTVRLAPSPGSGLRGVIDTFNALPLLENPELWIGVVVAAALLFATIRIRRHRDDS